jgi:hypothetical protein
MSLSFSRFCLLLIVLEAVFALSGIYSARRWDHFLIGDCPYYAATTESLVRDGDWDIRNQLEGPLENHNGFIALAKDNQTIVPKHSVLMPILSVPFFAAFGKVGFLIFNLLQLFALIVGIAELAGGGLSGRLLALAAYLTTPLLFYTYNYSPDVLSTALFVWSYVCAIDGRLVLGGFLAGLAVWAKVYLALFLLPLALVVLPRGWRGTILCAVAALVAALPMLAINLWIFGSPLISGYDREAHFGPNGFVVAEHYSRFQQPLFVGLGRLIGDPEIGLLKTAPLWFLWPVGLIVGWVHASRPRRFALSALTLSLLANLLFFAKYDEWNASAFGNRFLFPALAIGFALQGALWSGILGRLGRIKPNAA